MTGSNGATLSDEAISKIRVAVIGTGIAGLGAAAVLKSDGFDVHVLTKDASPGGNWSKEIAYPGLSTAGGYFEFQLPGQQYTEEELKLVNPKLSQIKAPGVWSYMNRYVDRFLSGAIRYQTEVKRIERPQGAKAGWELTVVDAEGTRKEQFEKLVMATGPHHNPNIPAGCVDPAGFDGVACHTSQLTAKYDEILVAAKGTPMSRLVVVGGGLSASDAAALFTKAGCQVTIVMKAQGYAVKIPKFKAPQFLRKSRFGSLWSPRIDLDSGITRFLHTTAFGAMIVRLLYKTGAKNCINGLNSETASTPVSPNSLFLYHPPPSRPSDLNDPEDFYNLVQAGRIEFVDGSYAVGYGKDRKSVLLENGQEIKADAVVFGTGFKGSVRDLFAPEQLDTIGLNPEPIPDKPDFSWPYKTLENLPAPPPNSSTPLFLRGIVPVANFDNRDLAFIGAIPTLNPGYTGPSAAHWVASYFRNDSFFRWDRNSALLEARRGAAWLRTRFPLSACLVNSPRGYGCNSGNALSLQGGGIAYADLLLSDLGLPTYRSGRGPLWMFKAVDVDELATVGEERRRKRESVV